MSPVGFSLVCFAVREEAAVFRKLAAGNPQIRICLTGMGAQNAQRSLISLLARDRPQAVCTCGFAGGLSPQFSFGTVLFNADPGMPICAPLLESGAHPGRFHCSERVVSTAKKKEELWKMTGADAVEMESQPIRAICAKEKIPSATVRVILDTAEEDLPLDFNEVMDSSYRIRFSKLISRVILSPRKITTLLQFQRKCQIAAHKLAHALDHALLIRSAAFQ